MDLAITRDVSTDLDRCELTHLERQPIDVARAQAQHEAYCRALESLGLTVVRLPGDAALPDCCFIEDTAIVLDEVAVLTRPGAESRRGELPVVDAALRVHRRVVRIEAPGTLDGGDVLHVGRRLFVGLSSRTTEAGCLALRAAVAPFGYDVVPVAVRGVLHLKSAVTALDDRTLLANPDWIEPGPFAGLELVPVPRQEPHAANVLAVGGRALLHAGFPLTASLLERRGQRPLAVDVSEFVKAEAGVTCKSLLVFDGGRGGA